MTNAGSATLAAIEKAQMDNHLKRCKNQDAGERQQRKELDFKNEENEIEVLNEQVKNGDLDYAMKTELFENMQKENLQLNQDMQDTCAQISDLMIDWPLKIELQRAKNKLNEALYLEKNLEKQSEQYLEMTAAMENLQMESTETSSERDNLEKTIATLQTLKAKMDSLQQNVSKIQMEVRFLFTKYRDFTSKLIFHDFRSLQSKTRAVSSFQRPKRQACLSRKFARKRLTEMS